MGNLADYGFPFNSINADREYTASEWREYFESLVDGGIVGDIDNELMVKEQDIPNKTVQIDTGAIFIKGALRKVEESINVEHSENISGSDRIDRVVARINYNDRKIEFVVKEGTPSASPTPPSLVRDSAVYELSLAQIYLANGYSTITDADITDERQDEGVCGYFRYRAKPAWYPGGDIPIDAWMYVAFKNELTTQEIEDIEDNPTLMEIINNSSIVGLPVGNVSNLSATVIPNTGIEIKWEDPPNLTTTDSDGTTIEISKWAGTKIVRKIGSYPASVNDGVLVTDSKVRDQYSQAGFMDSTAQLGNDYYYMLFPYSESRVDTVDSSNRINVNYVQDDTSGSPGSEFLLAGDSIEGFFGEVTAAELITGDALASEVGISAGTSQNSTAGWLKFALDDKIIFVAKKPIRHTISWDNIDAADCVYGNKTVVIGGLTYKVRLMKGALTDPSLYDTADRGAIGSEWNRLMLPIHVNAPSSWAYPGYVASPTKDWGIDYTDEDLLTHNTYGDGSYSWCQEVRNTNASYRVVRGGSGVSFSNANTSSFAPATLGWRPCLELVS